MGCYGTKENRSETYKADGSNDESSEDSSAVINKTLKLVNNYRATFKLAELIEDESMNTQAYEHSKKMGLGKRSFGHDGFKERISALPFKSMASAENVYELTDTIPVNEWAQRAVDGWTKSPGHRENMVGEDYNASGLGLFKGGGNVYFTHLFAKKPNV